MAHQSHRATPFTQSLIQTAKRNETHGMDSMPPKGLKVGFGRGKWFVRKPHLFQVDVKPCMRLSFVFPDMHRLLPPNIKPRKKCTCVTPVYDTVEEHGVHFNNAQDGQTGIHAVLAKC